MELRCPHSLHGILLDGEVLEVKCRSGFCGARRGVVVLHRFSARTGKLIETKRYKDTPELRRSSGHSAAVRSA